MLSDQRSEFYDDLEWKGRSKSTVTTTYGTKGRQSTLSSIGESYSTKPTTSAPAEAQHEIAEANTEGLVQLLCDYEVGSII